MKTLLINSENNFNGSVKEVETNTVSLFDRNGKVEEHLESTDYKLFDERKNLIGHEHYYAEKQRVKTVSSYDENNRKTSSLFYSDGLLISKYEFIYDHKGKLIEQKYFNRNEDFVSAHQPVYTNEGLRIEETIHEPVFIRGEKVQGTISFCLTPEIGVSFSSNDVYRSRTIYGKNDKLSEASFYKRNNKSLGKIFVAYDEKNRPIEVIKYGGNTSWFPGNLKLWQKMLLPLIIKLLNISTKFDSAYKLSRNREYKKAALCFKYGAPFCQTIIKYDENERTLELSGVNSFDINNRTKTIYKYDENKNLIEKKTLPDDSSFSVYERHEYEYDSQNNWIQKKSFCKMPLDNMTKFMEIKVLTTRNIVYY